LVRYFLALPSLCSPAAPALQLRTVKELMGGKGIERPSTVAATDETFKKAPESKKKHGEQSALEL
jgi:hypothetical protein